MFYSLFTVSADPAPSSFLQCAWLIHRFPYCGLSEHELPQQCENQKVRKRSDYLIPKLIIVEPYIAAEVSFM